MKTPSTPFPENEPRRRGGAEGRGGASGWRRGPRGGRACFHGFALLALGALLVLSAPARAVTFQEVNAALGLPLWNDESLWDEVTAEVATRLALPAESETKTSASFRAYPPEGALVFGARPYSVALAAQNTPPARLALVSANNGYSRNPPRPELLLARASGSQRTSLRRDQTEALRELPKAIQADADTLAAKLTALFGEPSTARLGAGRDMAEKGQRWDWGGHAFLLTVKAEQYVALRLMPSATLDAEGQAEAAPADFPDRVERRPNGDVVIGGLPMVDQGPKGYCVPATMERLLRYAGIPADMYVIAMAADTATGGGTSVKSAIAAAQDAARGGGHQFKLANSSLRLTNLSRYLDKGEPLLWTLNVNDELDRTVTARSQQRQGMSDPEQWKKVLKSGGRQRYKSEPENGHVCLIIGYNTATDEIAISDSWGPEFKERWIAVDEAEAITGRELYYLE